MNSGMEEFIEKHNLGDESRLEGALSYMKDKIVERTSYVYASMSIGLFPEDKLEELSSSIDAYRKLCAMKKVIGEKHDKDTEVSGPI